MRMGFVFRILWLVILVPIIFVSERVSDQAAERLALTHLMVIDVREGTTRADSTVLIVGNLIEAVGPSAAVRLPKHTHVVNSRGRFLIPGGMS